MEKLVSVAKNVFLGYFEMAFRDSISNAGVDCYFALHSKVYKEITNAEYSREIVFRISSIELAQELSDIREDFVRRAVGELISDSVVKAVKYERLQKSFWGRVKFVFTKKS